MVSQDLRFICGFRVLVIRPQLALQGGTCILRVHELLLLRLDRRLLGLDRRHQLLQLLLQRRHCRLHSEPVNAALHLE